MVLSRCGRDYADVVAQRPEVFSKAVSQPQQTIVALVSASQEQERLADNLQTIHDSLAECLRCISHVISNSRDLLQNSKTDWKQGTSGEPAEQQDVDHYQNLDSTLCHATTEIMTLLRACHNETEHCIGNALERDLKPDKAQLQVPSIWTGDPRSKHVKLNSTSSRPRQEMQNNQMKVDNQDRRLQSRSEPVQSSRTNKLLGARHTHSLHKNNGRQPSLSTASSVFEPSQWRVSLLKRLHHVAEAVSVSADGPGDSAVPVASQEAPVAAEATVQPSASKTPKPCPSNVAEDLAQSDHVVRAILRPEIICTTVSSSNPRRKTTFLPYLSENAVDSGTCSDTTDTLLDQRRSIYARITSGIGNDTSDSSLTERARRARALPQPRNWNTSSDDSSGDKHIGPLRRRLRCVTRFLQNRSQAGTIRVMIPTIKHVHTRREPASSPNTSRHIHASSRPVTIQPTSLSRDEVEDDDGSDASSAFKWFNL